MGDLRGPSCGAGRRRLDGPAPRGAAAPCGAAPVQRARAAVARRRAVREPRRPVRDGVGLGPHRSGGRVLGLRRAPVHAAARGRRRSADRPPPGRLDGAGTGRADLPGRGQRVRRAPLLEAAVGNGGVLPARRRRSARRGPRPAQPVRAGLHPGHRAAAGLRARPRRPRPAPPARGAQPGADCRPRALVRVPGVLGPGRPALPRRPRTAGAFGAALGAGGGGGRAAVRAVRAQRVRRALRLDVRRLPVRRRCRAGGAAAARAARG